MSLLRLTVPAAHGPLIRAAAHAAMTALQGARAIKADTSKGGAVFTIDIGELQPDAAAHLAGAAAAEHVTGCVIDIVAQPAAEDHASSAPIPDDLAALDFTATAPCITCAVDGREEPATRRIVVHVTCCDASNSSEVCASCSSLGSARVTAVIGAGVMSCVRCMRQMNLANTRITVEALT